MSTGNNHGVQEDDHSIKIKTSTWRALNARKTGPGDSFDDVITRLLDGADDGGGD